MSEDKNRLYEKQCLERVWRDAKEHGLKGFSVAGDVVKHDIKIIGNPDFQVSKIERVKPVPDYLRVSILIKSEFVEVDFGKGEFNIKDDDGVWRSYNIISSSV